MNVNTKGLERLLRRHASGEVRFDAPYPIRMHPHPSEVGRIGAYIASDSNRFRVG